MERYINLNVNKKYIITLVKNKIKLRKNLTVIKIQDLE